MFENLKAMMEKCEECNFPKGLNLSCKQCRIYRISMIEEVTGKEIPEDVKDEMLDLDKEEIKDIDEDDIDEELKGHLDKL